MNQSKLSELQKDDQSYSSQQKVYQNEIMLNKSIWTSMNAKPYNNDLNLRKGQTPFIIGLKYIKFLLITVVLSTLINAVQSCGCYWNVYMRGYQVGTGYYSWWYSCTSCIISTGCSNTPVWRFDVDEIWNFGYIVGYYECPPCVPNCKTCTDDVYCIQCFSGYVFDNASPPNCVLCSSISYCTSCSDGPVCNACSPGYTPNPIPLNKACMPCGFGNCESCGFVSGVLTCSSCFAGSVFDTSVSPQTCVSCSSISYCNTCADGPTCTLCNSPYVLAPSGSNQICVPCSYITGCNSCVDGPSCTACTLPYVLDTSTYPQICITCSSVIPNCNTCTDGPLCTGCTLPYVLDTGLSNSDPLVCVNCGTVFPNCNTCINGPLCTLCDTPFVFDTSTSPMMCVPCSVITDCATCDDGPVCTSCSTFNWVRDLSTGTHLLIDSVNKKCVECLIQIPNCQTCVDGPKCSVCIPDYVVNYNNNKSCVTCDYIPNCNTCVNGPVCTQCLAGLYLDFSTGNTSCASCSFYKCTQCTDGPRCIQCQPGFFLNTTYNLCMPCYFPCLTCDVSAISCTSCFSSNQLYYFDPGTKSCSLCYHNLTDCKACNMAGTQCTQCNSTLAYLDSSTKKCFPCTNNCQNCLTDLQCIDCITTNYAVDLISKQCKVCDSYMTRCLTCLTPSVCLTCNDTIYYLTYPPNQCVTCQQARRKCVTCTSTVGVGPTCIQCEDKFYIDNYECSHCPAPCALCTSFTVCSSCVSTRYALNNSMCVLCNQLITNCLECSSSTMCTFCVNSTILNPNGSGNCVPCGITQYPDQTNQICRDCLTPCYSCRNATQCITCEQFYEYVPAIKGCKDICGDEVVVVDICDNGFGVIHDGCSNECTQDPDFTCKNYTTTVSGQSVKKSVCSYNLKVDIKILQIKKEPFKNTMSWKYYVTPYLYGLPGTTSRSFTLQQLKDTFLIRERPTVSTASASEPQGIGLQVKAGVTSTLTVENVEVNAAESTVTVTMNYDADVKNSDIELFINFGYLRNGLGLLYFDTTQDSDKLYSVSSYQFYSMIGRFYTQDQYYQSNILNKVSLAIGLMSFFAFIIGIFTKEVIGLEMVMLCQFVYISLFYFKGTLELPFFALRSLIYSTGYNTGFEGSYQQMEVNPPQSLVLSYDTTTFSNNFNIMAVLYVLPLIIVIPFIPLKAKCIRKLTMIELGNKWVDLLLGEINLYGVLFNYQYFLFSLIVFYRDGRNSFNYPSSMIIWTGGFFTLCSFIGLILKPEIYGNFRSVFKYNKDLRSIDSKNGEKEVDLEEKLAKKFEGRGTCCYCSTSLKKKFRLFVNENYFWVNFRSLHTALTYNHYTLLIVYYTLTTLALTLIENSDLILVILSGIVLLELIIMRPYGKVSQKIRAIYFFIIYTGVSVIKFINNQIIGGKYNFMLSALIVALLGVALIWTYYTLIRYFIKFFTEQMSSRNVVVTKVFNSHLTDTFDKDLAAQQEQALIRKLMSRYERIELQYNLNNARGNLLSGYDMIIGQQIKKNQDNQEENAFVKIQSSQPKDKQNLFSKQLLEKVQQEQNYKNLKQIVQKQKKKRKKEQMKKRVTGQNLLKLLKLDNFQKYEKQYFTPEQQKRHNEYDQTDFKQLPQSLSIQTPQNQANQPKQAQDLGPCSEESQQKLSEKDDYESIEPQDFQEAKQKLDEQKIIIEQDQHIRYKRAAKIIASQGLTLDYDLIAQNYHNI